MSLFIFCKKNLEVNKALKDRLKQESEFSSIGLVEVVIEHSASSDPESYSLKLIWVPLFLFFSALNNEKDF